MKGSSQRSKQTNRELKVTMKTQRNINTTNAQANTALGTCGCAFTGGCAGNGGNGNGFTGGPASEVT